MCGGGHYQVLRRVWVWGGGEALPGTEGSLGVWWRALSGTEGSLGVCGRGEHYQVTVGRGVWMCVGGHYQVLWEGASGVYGRVLPGTEGSLVVCVWGGGHYNQALWAKGVWVCGEGELPGTVVREVWLCVCWRGGGVYQILWRGPWVCVGRGCYQVLRKVWLCVFGRGEEYQILWRGAWVCVGRGATRY